MVRPPVAAQQRIRAMFWSSASTSTKQTLNKAKPILSLKQQQKPEVIAEPEVQIPVSVKPVSESCMTNFTDAGMIEASSKIFYPNTEDTNKELVACESSPS